MTRQQRASQIWSLLICAARERKSYTYGDIAKILGYGGAGVLAQTLGLIMEFCENNDLPPLTVLVVNQDTGLPGEGLTTLEELNQDRESVFRYDWFSLEPPQNSDFHG
jgi:alkylated DNA nucleotide flippase Atl1